MGVVDEVGRHAMEAVDKSRNDDTENMPTAVPDPPQEGGVKAAPEVGKQKPTQNAGIVAERVTEKATAGRSAPIRTNPDPARPGRIIDKVRTTRKDRRDPKTVRDQSSW